jgi:hypothetical protein
LELFAIGRGSAVMSFASTEPPSERPQGSLDIDIEELGEAAVRRVATSLKAAGSKRGHGAIDIDPSVKATLQEMGKLFGNGVSRIDWIVPAEAGKRGSGIRAKFDDEVLARIDGRSSTGPAYNEVKLDGRLEMADFKIGDLKCLIHLSDGRRIVMTFSPDLEEEVYAALRRVVQVGGLGTYARPSNQLEKIDLRSLKILNPTFAEGNDFFATHSLAELTAAQGVSPSFDIQTLENAWPGDEDIEVFLAATRS